MEASFELTEDDLLEVQAQRLILSREALQASPRVFLLVAALGGLVGWALMPLFTDAITLPRFIALWLFAALLALLLTPHLGRLRSPRLDRWNARRMARLAARQSVLGPVTVQLGDEALVRRNAAGELRVAWSQVQDVLASPGALTVVLRGEARVVVLPTRVLPDVEAVLERLERLVGRPCVRLDLERGSSAQADASGALVPRRPARTLMRPALLTLLALSLLALGFQHGHAWYSDPRRSNGPGQVVMYSTSWCPACAVLRDCLQRHQVPFEERDIEGSTRARSEWAALEGTGIPVTLVGQRVVYGVDPEELRGTLGEVGYTVDCAVASAPEP